MIAAEGLSARELALFVEMTNDNVEYGQHTHSSTGVEPCDPCAAMYDLRLLATIESRDRSIKALQQLVDELEASQF